jgi:transposase
VLLKIVYLLTCRVLGAASLAFRGDQAKTAELLVLRHENGVLRRHVTRVWYDPADRVWFAALARLLPRRRWPEIFPVTPATLLAWHRRLAAKKRDTSKQRKPGRPPAARSITRLAVRLAKENPLWEYHRIHGELTKLGLALAPSTVWEILHAAGIDPAPRRSGPTWRQFPARPGRRDPRGRPPARRHGASLRPVRSFPLFTQVSHVAWRSEAEPHCYGSGHSLADQGIHSVFVVSRGCGDQQARRPGRHRPLAGVEQQLAHRHAARS